MLWPAWSATPDASPMMAELRQECAAILVRQSRSITGLTLADRMLVLVMALGLEAGEAPSEGAAGDFARDLVSVLEAAARASWRGRVDALLAAPARGRA